MPLIHCPECGHEVSASAVACPSCGRPLTPKVEPVRPVAAAPVAVRTTRREFPTWAYVPIAILGVLVLFLLFVALRGSNEDEVTTNLNINASRRAAINADTTDRGTDVRTTTVPPSSDQTVTLPPPAPPADQQTTTVPGTTTEVRQPPPDRGTAVIRARIVPARGGSQPQPARNVRFFLLEKDIESLLSEARIEPIEGNSLTASLGLAIVHPDRYGDFQRRAMRVLTSRAKFSGSTGSDGGASISGISPDSYYLFGIVKVGNGFALWNSPVSIIAGENVLELSPQNITEIPDISG